MHVDLSPLAQVGLDLLVYVLGSAPFLALVGTALIKLLRVQQNSAARDTINMAVQRAGALAHDALANLGPMRWNPDIRNKTVAGFANYVASRAPDALAHHGITLPVIETMITAELSKLEAASGVTPPVAALTVETKPAQPVDAPPSPPPSITISTAGEKP